MNALHIVLCFNAILNFFVLRLSYKFIMCTKHLTGPVMQCECADGKNCTGFN